MTNDDRNPTPSRRSVLKSVPAAGTYLSFSGLAAGRTDTVEAGDLVQLGEFSDGLDGWKTSGENKLDRVSEGEMPTAVTVGTHALGVEYDGDLHPMIENKKRVKKADLENHPYLLMDVIGYAEETDSDLVFTFRLHHTAAPADGEGKSKSGGKNVLVEESEEMTVSPLNPRLLRWDMTELDREVLRTAKRLEITWYFEDRPPRRGARGRAKGDLQGRTIFDNIRLTDDAPGAEAAASQEKKLDLHRKHGMIMERTFDERSPDEERGTLVFGDGTEIPYAFEVLSDGQFRYTLDDESFVMGGGGGGD